MDPWPDSIHTRGWDLCMLAPASSTTNADRTMPAPSMSATDTFRNLAGPLAMTRTPTTWVPPARVWVATTVPATVHGGRNCRTSMDVSGAPGVRVALPRGSEHRGMLPTYSNLQHRSGAPQGTNTNNLCLVEVMDTRSNSSTGSWTCKAPNPVPVHTLAPDAESKSSWPHDDPHHHVVVNLCPGPCPVSTNPFPTETCSCRELQHTSGNPCHHARAQDNSPHHATNCTEVEHHGPCLGFGFRWPCMDWGSWSHKDIQTNLVHPVFFITCPGHVLGMEHNVHVALRPEQPFFLIQA